jgi:hypothetical protein
MPSRALLLPAAVALLAAAAPASAQAWTRVDAFRVTSFSGSGRLVRDAEMPSEQIHMVTRFSWRSAPSHPGGGADIAVPRGRTPLFSPGRFPGEDDGIRLSGRRSVTVDGAIKTRDGSAPYHCTGADHYARADGGELDELAARASGTRVAVTLPIAVTEKPMLQARCAPPVAGGRHVFPAMPGAATSFDVALDDDMAATARITRARLRHGRIRLALRAATSPDPRCGAGATCSQSLRWHGRLVLTPACGLGAFVRRASGHVLLECDTRR